MIPAMSSASSTRADQLRGIDLQSLHSTVVTPFRFVGFWTAVFLPFVYLPLLFTTLDGATVTAFAGLLAVHVLSIVIGRKYNDREPDS